MIGLNIDWKISSTTSLLSKRGSKVRNLTCTALYFRNKAARRTSKTAPMMG